MTEICPCCGAERFPSYSYGAWRSEGGIGGQPRIFFNGEEVPAIPGAPGRLLAAMIRSKGKLRTAAGAIMSAKSQDANGVKNLWSNMTRLRQHVACATGGAWEIPRPEVNGHVYVLRERK
jgi:hypothetical protein